MWLYGFIPAFGGNHRTIHHPPPCPDSSPPWQPLTLTTPFTEHYTLIYGLVFFPTDHSALGVMVYLRFSETFKRRMGRRAFSYQRPPLPDCCGPGIGDLLYFCSASSVIFLCDVSVCSSHFFQPSRLLQLPFSSAFTQQKGHYLMSLGPLKGSPFKKPVFLVTLLFVTDPINKLRLNQIDTTNLS